MEQEIKSAEEANYISQAIREYNIEIKVIVKLPFNEYIIKHDELLVNLYDKFILPTHSKDVKPEPISDAVEFAEWIKENYGLNDYGSWVKYSYIGRQDPIESVFTSEELYEQFKSTKPQITSK